MPNNKCKHGKSRDYCKECRPELYCEHNKVKRRCKDCGGTDICEHNKRKDQCKICNTSLFCKHERRKDGCIECCPKNFCIHKKVKLRCKLCGSKYFCEHGKKKERCLICDGSAICEHKILKQCCKKCKGSQICKHEKFKPTCRECGGSSYCIHDRIKLTCKKCNGSQLCIHKKHKSYCKDCNGSQICKHKKHKKLCIECGGSGLCKTPLCETAKIKKYKGYCYRCFVIQFPDEPNARNYKTKERTVKEYVLENYPDKTIISDKKIEDGCSKRRPDLVIDLGYQVIVIEIDENQHIDYDCSCENKRLMEISKDVGHRPLVFIRFNPDTYKDKENKTITSCWGYDTTGLAVIKKTKEKEWNFRLDCLKQQIDYWLDNKTEKTVEVIQLFYDQTIESKEIIDKVDDSVISHVPLEGAKIKNYDLLTVPLLKDECRSVGLKVSGNKSELIKRLEEYY